MIMKKLKFLIYLVLIIFIASCTKNFEDFNTDTKNPSDVPGETLFSNAQKALADQRASTNVNINVFKLWSQYWTETTYTDEANFDIVNRNIPDNNFSTYYRSILLNLKQAKYLIEKTEVVGDEAKKVQKNKAAIIDLLTAFTYQELVDIFGNVPYTDALKIEETLSPKYDDGLTIYKDLITTVTAAIGKLDESAGSFDVSDLYYGGDVALWKKFGNSLKLKLGLHLADVDNTLAKSTIESAFTAGVILNSDDACKMTYLGSSPNTNPIYEDLVLSGRQDFVAANTIVDIMNPLNDPRRGHYFTLKDGAFIGGTYGINSAFIDFSHPGDAIYEPTLPSVFFSASELKFYLAEAAARGYSVGNTAENYYKDAIATSILEWGGNQADADTYLAQAGVAYNGADWKKSIGTQEWIAFYTRGLEGWTTWRRLDAPTFNISPDAQSPDGKTPTRFTYPVNEQTLNKTNYQQASTAIGGDVLNKKLFWDKN